MNPSVTVLMPVYNGASYLREALESVLCQDYDNMQFMVINDGSSDHSGEILSQFRDSRLKILSHTKNVGIAQTLNEGIAMIDSKYIVRMDQDDVSLPGRLMRQVGFMEANRNIVMSGTNIKYIGSGIRGRTVFPATSEAIRSQMILKCVINHPTVIFRNASLRRFGWKYIEEGDSVEDYRLWSEITPTHEIANIADITLLYRINSNGMTREAEKKSFERNVSIANVQASILRNLNYGVSFELLLKTQSLFQGGAGLTLMDFEAITTMYVEISRVFDERYDVMSYRRLASEIVLFGLKSVEKGNHALFDGIVNCSRRIFLHPPFSRVGFKQRVPADLFLHLRELSKRFQSGA